VQLALPALLAHHPATARSVRARLAENLASLDAGLTALGSTSPVRRFAVQGGWYAVLEVPRLHDDDAWVELLLREEGVLVHPGYFFDFEGDGILVLSLLPKAAEFRDGVARLLRRIVTG
jgi:aspartate/methionine/tyrosine aminotransferase